ncbi:Glutamine--fructose-6-phosphate aminotransferase [isomerizing] [Alphaproteobacteria bacterium SO-S41]|nr:Glutamine--fructose-6-phosphate aminotransferase [isomerizing] [Alphaproteobacteria bacterium SO-S41]
MCGIVGIIGNEEAAPLIVEALKRLEYRGYDSAGIATLHDGQIDRRRAPGKLRNLGALLGKDPLPGVIGIGHTRWATHGAPTENNAHPHASDSVAVVHNGIIENFRELRDELTAKGHVFATETDTEVTVHLVTENLRRGMDPVAAAQAAVKRFDGAFALVIMFRGDEDLLIGTRRGSPLAVGYGDGEMYFGSDAFALAPFTNRVTYLEEGDLAVLRRSGATIFDVKDNRVERPIVLTQAGAALVDKGNHRHFMAKEIYEQPEVLGHTVHAYVNGVTESVALPKSSIDWSAVTKLTMVACGTSSIATNIAQYWFEQLAQLPSGTDIASEFRYRDTVLIPGGVSLFVSQSGETADTLAALKHARAAGQKIASVVNVAESSMARESDAVYPTHAGPEIGVASTKAFVCQLGVLASLAIAAGRARGVLPRDAEIRLTRRLLEMPRLIGEALKQEEIIASIAQEIAKARDVLFMGRGLSYPIAMEGALKLKEISYIHAEGYAAGELKHGPIALIDENVPVIVIAPHDALFEKTISNMQEVMARGGKVLLISDKRGHELAGDNVWMRIEIPECDPVFAPLVSAVPVQLLAYYTALAKGTDVDQPRNLAKSVTVE